MTITVSYSQPRNPHDDYREYDSGGNRVFVPRYRNNLNGYRNSVAISEEESKVLAEKFFKLRAAVVACFGDNQIVASGPVGGSNSYSYNSASEFSILPINQAIKKLREALAAQGSIEAKSSYRIGRDDKVNDKMNYRLKRREDNPAFFTVDASNGLVYGFSNKTSPLRAAAKSLSNDFVIKFDADIDSYMANPNSLTVDEFILILNETRRLAVERLKSLDIVASDATVTAFLELQQIKSYRVVKEILTEMPYLKVERELDKNLALMAGRGLTYERMLVFNVSENYPKDDEALTDALNIPLDWMLLITA